MGLVGFLQFFVKCCVDFLAWPLLALAYPLFASIRAIETNSVMDTQKLNTYWVVFSLILLLEHALSLFVCMDVKSEIPKKYIHREMLNVLVSGSSAKYGRLISVGLTWFPQQFPFWPYIRLISVCLLVIPYFDGAFYVYKQVICPLLSMDYHIMMSWFTISKEASIETEIVLAEVEKYVKENGTEALEKIIASKSSSTENLEVREIEALSSTDNDGVNQPCSDGPYVERKDIEAVEVIEKNEATAATQVSRVEPELTQTKSRMALPAETRESVSKVQARREYTHTHVSKVVQKEWTCTVCRVTTYSEVDFISHIRGKRHEATMNEATKAKNQMIFLKGLEPRVTRDERLQGKQKSVGPASSPNKSNDKEGNKTSPSNSKLKQKTNIKHEDKTQGGKPTNQKKGTVEAKDSYLWCRVCNISCSGNTNMKAHLRGKKHLTQVISLTSK